MHPTQRRVVLVLGAFGTFGRRITDALCQVGNMAVIAAGRHVPANLSQSRASLHALRIDNEAISGALLNELRPEVVIDTVGPFQARDRKIAQSCIDLGIHYIDLADDREFVQGVVKLHAAALDRNTLIVSGASTLPALSSAVIKDLAAAFSTIDEIDIGISPGYAAPRGLATIRSVLGYAGNPIPVWRDARMQTADGWTENLRYCYPSPVGVRNLSLVDVPDMSLIPVKFPGLKRLTVRAGLEVPVVHHGLRLLAGLVRLGMLHHLADHARFLQRAACWFDRFGSDCGAMHVRLRGAGLDGSSLTSTWSLVAQNGDGPQVPATAAVLIAKRLLEVPGYPPMTVRGAVAALNLLALSEFEREWRPLALRTFVRSDSRARGACDSQLKVSLHRAP